MNNVLNVYKPIGKTPLEMIQSLRMVYPDYQCQKITYAGRLDPLAHGVLILLVEPETKKSKAYYQLTKTYQMDILFGVGSDTYDILGIPTRGNDTSIHDLSRRVASLVGTRVQSYPPYSSAPVAGKPLFQWAREGKLQLITIPTKQIEIFTAELITTFPITSQELSTLITDRIDRVSGDFRQEIIRESWSQLLKESQSQSYQVARIVVTCSSGTYMRGIANALGEELRTNALALDILRTRVGDFSLQDSLRLE